MPLNNAGAAPSLEAERDLLIQATRDAAPLAMALFREGQATAAALWSKQSDSSPVTEADLAVNARLRRDLLAARPDYGWLSEEDEDDPVRLGRERVFIVDPIDGTRSFAEGRPEFCLSVAVAEAGVVLAAAIFAPAMDALYDAALGLGARRNLASIRAAAPAEADGARILASRANLAAMRWPFPPLFERGYVQPIAYRLCLVADGAWDGMVALKDTNEWDVAGGALIAAEAGALVTDRDGAAYAFNKTSPRVAGALVAAAGLHATLRAGVV